MVVTAPLILVTIVVCIAFCATLNVAIERVAYRPLRNAPKLAPLITAIGMSFILQNAAALVYGFIEQPLPDIFPTKALFTIGGIAYTQKSLLIVLITIPVLLALTYLVRSTRQGKAMRAVAQDMDASRDDGDRRRSHDRLHLRARRRAGRGRRTPVRDVPDLDPV